MVTLNLLARCPLSLVALGLLLGASLGAAYGFFLLTVAGPIAGVLADGSGYGLGNSFAGFLGVIYGGAFGASAGLALGALDGLLLFALTRAFYFPQPRNTSNYRKVAGATCAAAALAALLAFLAINGTYSFVALSESAAVTFILGGLIPVALAALSAWLSGDLVARLNARSGVAECSA